MASPLSSCGKRDSRSERDNTTVGFREYRDIGGLRIYQFSTPGAHSLTYIIILFAAFVRFDTVATCGSTGGMFALPLGPNETGSPHL